MKAVKSGRTAEAEPKPQPLFKNDGKQLVLYWPRVAGASSEEKALAREALTNALANLGLNPEVERSTGRAFSRASGRASGRAWEAR